MQSYVTGHTPGWVRTDMGGSGADINAAGIIALTEQLTDVDSGNSIDGTVANTPGR